MNTQSRVKAVVPTVIVAISGRFACCGTSLLRALPCPTAPPFILKFRPNRLLFWIISTHCPINGNLREDVAFCAQSQASHDRTDHPITQHQHVQGDHGRIETRITTVFHNISWVQEHHAWPGLKSLVMVQRIREIGQHTEKETDYDLSSLSLPAHTVDIMRRFD